MSILLKPKKLTPYRTRHIYSLFIFVRYNESVVFKKLLIGCINYFIYKNEVNKKRNDKYKEYEGNVEYFREVI